MPTTLNFLLKIVRLADRIMTDKKPSLTIELGPIAELDKAVAILLEHVGDRHILAFTGEIGNGKKTG